MKRHVLLLIVRIKSRCKYQYMLSKISVLPCFKKYFPILTESRQVLFFFFFFFFSNHSKVRERKTEKRINKLPFLSPINNESYFHYSDK
jgi:hypothetical protein